VNELDIDGHATGAGVKNTLEKKRTTPIFKYNLKFSSSFKSFEVSRIYKKNDLWSTTGTKSLCIFAQINSSWNDGEGVEPTRVTTAGDATVS